MVVAASTRSPTPFCLDPLPKCKTIHQVVFQVFMSANFGSSLSNAFFFFFWCYTYMWVALLTDIDHNGMCVSLTVRPSLQSSKLMTKVNFRFVEKNGCWPYTEKACGNFSNFPTLHSHHTDRTTRTLGRGMGMLEVASIPSDYVIFVNAPHFHIVIRDFLWPILNHIGNTSRSRGGRSLPVDLCGRFIVICKCLLGIETLLPQNIVLVSPSSADKGTVQKQKIKCTTLLAEKVPLKSRVMWNGIFH